jgi:ribokinase
MSARPVILCAGALHYQMIVDAPSLPRLDQPIAGTAARHGFGGRGAAQAAAAARAGAEVHMAGAVGSDDLAIALRAGLDDVGVRRRLVQTHPGASGLSVVVMLPDGSSGVVTVAGANLLLRADAVSFPKDCALLLLQGEIAEAANINLAARARSAGIRTVMNAVPARAIAPEILALIDLLVVNRREAADLLGRAEAQLDAARAAEDLAVQGPKAVMVTLGSDGLIIAEGGRLTLQPAHRVGVMSACGVGDVFVGALAAEWARGAPLAAAAAFGQAAAGLHVSLPEAERTSVDEPAIRDSQYA